MSSCPPALVVDHAHCEVAGVDAQVEGDAPHHYQPQLQPWGFVLRADIDLLYLQLWICYIRNFGFVTFRTLDFQHFNIFNFFVYKTYV